MKLFLVAAAVIAIGYVFWTTDLGGTDTNAAPAECIELAQQRGVPEAVVEAMKRPHEELNELERTAIRAALSGLGADNACERFLK